ncbi:hypothetical protein Pmani_026129 [Petrolisthes manimaculis]|uniref:Uncharacterized protein n=1 Tax=Petrolisthes manimaculis TaxID=1843537 RepID=A0AAE1P5C3_9EUCA|nr:hypothetical protein Pmani_026129 [Petrolisthes manimaculis]
MEVKAMDGRDVGCKMEAEQMEQTWDVKVEMDEEEGKRGRKKRTKSLRKGSLRKWESEETGYTQRRNDIEDLRAHRDWQRRGGREGATEGIHTEIS